MVCAYCERCTQRERGKWKPSGERNRIPPLPGGGWAERWRTCCVRNSRRAAGVSTPAARKALVSANQQQACNLQHASQPLCTPIEEAQVFRSRSRSEEGADWRGSTAGASVARSGAGRQQGEQERFAILQHSHALLAGCRVLRSRKLRTADRGAEAQHRHHDGKSCARPKAG